MAQPAKADDYEEQVCPIKILRQRMHFGKHMRKPFLLLVAEERFRSFHTKDFHKNHMATVCQT